MRINAIPRMAAALAVSAILAALFAASAAAQGPTVTTDAATGVTVTKATLNATIDTHGNATSYAFEYGPTTEYGSYTEAASIPAGAGSPVQVTAALEGLQSNTTYHFRIWAIGGGEVVSGKDVTFKTLQGLYMAGEESEKEADQPRIATTETGKFMGGEVSPQAPFTVLETPKTGAVVCQEGGFYGGQISPSEPKQSFYLSALYGFSECELEGLSTTVKMNGCRYAYSIANAGPPYVGSVDEIECAAGKGIEAVVTGYCTLKIPGQSLEGSATYEETAYEGSGAVEAAASSAGVAFEKVPGSGPWCFLFESGSGSFNGSVTLF